jgi:hypothetical protein
MRWAARHSEHASVPTKDAPPPTRDGFPIAVLTYFPHIGLDFLALVSPAPGWKATWARRGGGLTCYKPLHVEWTSSTGHRW